MNETAKAILADGHARELSSDVFNELIRRLERMGIERRDPETGRVVEQSASAATAERLRDYVDSGAGPFVPTKEDRGSLAWALRDWLDDVKVSAFPSAAMELRYALAREAQGSRGEPGG